MKAKFNQSIRWTGGLCLWLVLLLTSCEKDERGILEASDIPSTTHLKADVVHISPSEGASLSMSENELLVARDSDLGRKIVKGKTLYSEGFGQSPDGLLVKVVSVSREGDQLRIGTEPGRFIDLFEQANISFAETFGANDTANGKTDEWVEPLTLKLTYVLYDEDNNVNTTFDQVRLVGALHFTNTVEFDYIKRSGDRFASYMKLINTCEINGSLRMIAGGDLPELDYERNVKTKELAPFTVIVPGLGVPLRFGHEFTLSLGAKGDGNIEVQGGYAAKMIVKGGFEYRDGAFDPQFDFISQENGPLIPVYNASGRITGYAKVKYTIWPANQKAVGAYVTAATGPELDIDLSRPNDEIWKINLLTTIGAGLDINFWGLDLSPGPLEQEFRLLLGQGGSGNSTGTELEVLSSQYYTKGINDCYSTSGQGNSVDLHVIFNDPAQIMGNSGTLYIQNLDEDTGLPDLSPILITIDAPFYLGASLRETVFNGCATFGGDNGYIDAQVWVEAPNGQRSNTLDIRLFPPGGGKQSGADKAEIALR